MEKELRGKLKKVNPETCELEGPYECPYCNGHIMLDSTFLDQVHLSITCPYCENEAWAPPAGDPDEGDSLDRVVELFDCRGR